MSSKTFNQAWPGLLRPLWILTLLSALVVSAGLQANSQPLPEPDASLEPAEVVRIVIDALAINDQPYPDAGIETAFNFASPQNKANTGPLKRFQRMVKDPVFAAMLNHRQSSFSEVVYLGAKAYQMVELISAEGLVVNFAFRLGLQTEGEFEGMWMTDAVWPLQSQNLGIGA